MGNFLLKHYSKSLKQNEILNRPRYKKVTTLTKSGCCELLPHEEKYSIRKLLIDTSRTEDEALKKIASTPHCPCQTVLCSGDSFAIHVSCAGTYHVPCLLNHWKQQKNTLKCFHCGNQPTQNDPFVLIPSVQSYGGDQNGDDWEHSSGLIVLEFVNTPYEHSSSEKTLDFLRQVATKNYTYGSLLVNSDDNNEAPNDNNDKSNPKDPNDKSDPSDAPPPTRIMELRIMIMISRTLKLRMAM